MTRAFFHQLQMFQYLSPYYHALSAYNMALEQRNSTVFYHRHTLILYLKHLLMQEDINSGLFPF